MSHCESGMVTRSGSSCSWDEYVNYVKIFADDCSSYKGERQDYESDQGYDNIHRGAGKENATSAEDRIVRMKAQRVRSQGDQSLLT